MTTGIKQPVPWRFTEVTSILCIAGGFLVLFGWMLNIQILKSISPFWVTMKANTALCFILVGAALWLLRTESASSRVRIVAALGIVPVIFVGALTLAEYVTQWNFGIDQFLFAEKAAEEGHAVPGRMSPVTAGCFILLGCALLGLDWKTARGFRPTALLPLFATLCGLFAITGYLYGAETPIQSQTIFAPLALHTAGLFIVLSLGILCARPDQSVISMFTGPGVGSGMARRLLPLAVALPVFLGYIRLLGQEAGFYSYEMGLTLLVISLIVVFALLIWRTGVSLNCSEAKQNEERRQAEDALQKPGALQNAIFNSANFSSIATDELGVIQIFNVGAERMLGYAAADVVNKITPAEISDSREVIARAQALSLELGTTIAPGFDALVFKALRGIEDIYELTYIRKDGSRFPAIVSVTALRDDKERIIGYLLIGTDNSARKRAEDALLKAGALQNAIFNSANFSSIATDEKGVIQIFNVGAERMLGYAAVEVLNRITPAEISDSQEVIARAKELSLELGSPIAPGFEALVFKASRGIEDIYELTYIRKDGSRFPAVVSVTALRGDDDRIIGYLLIGTDNTARKQIEEERKKLDQRLRDQQFYTRSLIEANIDAIMTTDPLGIITDVNKQMEALTGCTRDELIGAPFKNYFTDPDRAEDAIKLMLLEKKVADYELTARARDGKETVVSYNATTFYDRDRKLQGVFAAARDVTERKRSELALQETNVALEGAKLSAETANLAKSDFLSSMSHELRSPLNAILGFAQLMETSNPPPTESQSARITQILLAGWHLLKLIEEILDLSVIESGKLSLSQESVLLNLVMTECQTMMEPEALRCRVQMSFQSSHPEIYVRADRTRLKQVIINLLSNAIKYNKEDGSVEVAYSADPHGAVRISVTDSGEGLSQEKLAQLFQPFNRLGQEEGNVTGTGIGLVVTKRLVELMGGVFGVESTPGKGSVFWCELATVSAPQLGSEDDENEVPTRPHRSESVPLRSLLCVEDNPANMELVRQLVDRRLELQMLTAVNGMLAIEIAKISQPTVILMDINLPGISGIQALKLLQEETSTAHIPVVAMSANAMPRDIKRGLDAGFFRYLTKPIKVEDFMKTLNDALEFADKPAPK